MSKILDGRPFSRLLSSNLAHCINKIGETIGKKFKPTLAILQVGMLPASEIYIKHKLKFGKECGINVYRYRLPKCSTFQQIYSAIEELNGDPDINGIILQLPIDSNNPNIDEYALLNRIDSSKDVDGLTDSNVALLSRSKVDVLHLPSFAQKNYFFIPCTALACMYLIRLTGIKLEGRNCTVIGRSRLVGAPVAQLLMNHLNATVTICNSKTLNLKTSTINSDLVIVAAGVPNLINDSFIKPGAIVIDCGINFLNSVSENSKKLVGDVDFQSVKQVVSHITPVPGGVGPLTVAMLFRNTLYASLRQLIDSDLSYSSRIISLFKDNSNFNLEF